MRFYPATVPPATKSQGGTSGGSSCARVRSYGRSLPSMIAALAAFQLATMQTGPSVANDLTPGRVVFRANANDRPRAWLGGGETGNPAELRRRRE